MIAENQHPSLQRVMAFSHFQLIVFFHQLPLSVLSALYIFSNKRQSADRAMENYQQKNSKQLKRKQKKLAEREGKPAVAVLPLSNA